MTYSIRDLQNRFSITEQTVLTWIHSGELKAVNVGRSMDRKIPRWRVTEQALAAFEERRTPSPPVPHTRRRKQDGKIVEFY